MAVTRAPHLSGRLKLGRSLGEFIEGELREAGALLLGAGLIDQIEFQAGGTFNVEVQHAGAWLRVSLSFRQEENANEELPIAGVCEVLESLIHAITAGATEFSAQQRQREARQERECGATTPMPGQPMRLHVCALDKGHHGWHRTHDDGASWADDQSGGDR